MTDEVTTENPEDSATTEANKIDSKSIELLAKHLKEGKVLSREEAENCKTWSLPTMQSKQKATLSKKYVKPDYFARIQDAKRNHLANEIKKGYEEGFAKGEREAKAKEETYYKERAQILNNVIASLNTELAGLQSKLEQDIIEMVVAICNVVLNYSMEHVRDLIIETTKAAIVNIPANSKNLVVSVNPEDYTCLKEAKDSGLFPDFNDMAIIEDLAVGKGGCVLRTSTSKINCNIKNIFANVLSKLNIEYDKDLLADNEFVPKEDEKDIPEAKTEAKSEYIQEDKEEESLHSDKDDKSQTTHDEDKGDKD